MRHELKTWPAPFAAVEDGLKTFEIRRADRPFSVGDRLRLREWIPSVTGEPSDSGEPSDFAGYYTGCEVEVEVTFLEAGGQRGLPDNLCVMAIRRVLS